EEVFSVADELEGERTQQAEKQARAEVLAAVLTAFDKRKAVCDLDEELKQHGTIIAIFRHRIAELQPAASDLEALLREERLEEARLRPHQDGCAALLTGAEADDCDDWCGRNKRIAELEKARAEGKE
ncbi:hypothetical protein LCGC14_1579360, partial [marine sediment metagenome]